MINMMPTFLNIYIGEFELAKEASKQLGLDDWSLLFKTWGLLYTNNYKEAFAELSKVSEISKNVYMFKAILLLINGCLKKDTEFKQLVYDEKFILWAKKDFQYSLFVADAFAMINQKKESLNWIENSINNGNVNFPFINEYDPFLKNIRGEERFKKLMERVKYEWENFEV